MTQSWLCAYGSADETVVGVAKVGWNCSDTQTQMMAELIEAGFKVFVDLKLADIPTTTREGGQGPRRARRLLPHDPHLRRPQRAASRCRGVR